MMGLLFFCACLLLQTAAVLLALAAPRLPLPTALSWFVATFAIGACLALFGRRFGRGVLIIAIPLSVLSAYALQQRLWPPPLTEVRVLRLHEDAVAREQLGPWLKTLLPLQSDSIRFCSATPRRLLPALSLQVAQGIELTVVADAVADVRALTFDDQGRLWLSQTALGRVLCLSDSDADGWYDRRQLVVDGLDRPMGLCWQDGRMLLATATDVVRLPRGGAPLQALGLKLPRAAAGEYRPLLSPSGRTLYLPVAGIGVQPPLTDWRLGTLLRIDLPATAAATAELHAVGLHQCGGLAWHPLRNEVWATEVAPPRLDFTRLPNEVNVVRPQADYGWPFCFGRQQPDVTWGTTAVCQQTVAPLLQLPPALLPTALQFGSSLAAPAPLRAMLYLVVQGQGDDGPAGSYRLLGVPLDEAGQSLGWGIDLVRGWHNGRRLQGLPTALAIGPDGALYLGDALAGLVYRLRFVPAANSG